MRYVGIDWADTHHDLCCVDEQGQKVSRLHIDNTREGLDKLLEYLKELGRQAGGAECILIGIETSHLMLVDVLLNAGYSIYPLNPKAVDRYRDRYTTSGAKSDAFDAELIAQALRTDRDRFRKLMPDSELLRELRLLVHDQRRFIRTQTLLGHQLRDSLKAYFPVAVDLFSDLTGPSALAFLAAYPKPGLIPVKKLEKLLRQARYPQPEKKAAQIVEQVRRGHIETNDFIVRAKSRAVVTLVEQLQTLRQRLDQYEKEIEALFEKHPDASVIKSLPGSGPSNGPRLLIELGDNRQRYDNPDGLQCEAGTSPVTKASGNGRIVTVRRACRKSFRDAVHQFAFCSTNQSAWAKHFYQQQRARGNTNASALRALGDKWLKIIYRLWKDRVPYDENIFLAARTRQAFHQVPVPA